MPPMTAVERISHEGEISKEGFRAVQDVANQAKEALIQATEDKAAYEKQYIKFRKFLSASSKDIPLSEIVDCIDKVVVDGGGKIVVKWSIDQNRIGAVGTNMENP